MQDDFKEVGIDIKGFAAINMPEIILQSLKHLAQIKQIKS